MQDEIVKMKMTKCIKCFTDIEQRKKEGILLCDSCAKKFENKIKEEVNKLNIDCDSIYVSLGTSSHYGNWSHKTTKIYVENFNGINLKVWIETKNLIELINIESQYISNYIMSKINESYYFILSKYEYNSKLYEIKNKIEEGKRKLYE